MLNITIDYVSFLLGILTACGLKIAWSCLRALSFYGRAIRQQSARPLLHIRKTRMLFPFLIAGLLTGTSLAEALPEGSYGTEIDSLRIPSGSELIIREAPSPFITWHEAPRQMFTLIGEMPNWAVWLLLIAGMWFYGYTLRFIRRTAYSSGYAEGYADTTAVINEVGQDLHTRLTSES